MTVRSVDGDERRPRILSPGMAILTRHAGEAFPGETLDMGGATASGQCSSLVRSGNARSLSQHFDVVVDSCSPRLCTLSLSSSSSSPPLAAGAATTTTTSRGSVRKPKAKSGSTRSSSFDKRGPTWVAATMLQSDLVVEVADMSFHLHKFPLLSRSGRLNRLVFESRDTEKDLIKLPNIPGGPSAFELCIKFCYGLPTPITRFNVAALRCAADYLEMTEDLEPHNLISQTEDFLSAEVFTSWSDSITVLRTCASLLPWAETLPLVKLCSESIAWKACTDPRGLRWSYSSAGNDSPSLSLSLSPKSSNSSSSSAKTSTSSKSLLPLTPHDWWFSDVAELDLRSFTVVMEAIQSKGMRPDMMGSAILSYAHRWLPTLTEISSPPNEFPENKNSKNKNKTKNKQKKIMQATKLPSERAILEGLVRLLPAQKDSLPITALLRLLRVAIFLDASPACRTTLEALSGTQLDQATLPELLLPSCPFRPCDTFYDVGAVHRCLDHFLVQDHIQQQISATNHQHHHHQHHQPPPHSAAMMRVAQLLDSYLAEIARDAALTLAQFQALAEALPASSRLTDDGLYRAIDTFLKAHPGVNDRDRKKLCRMMECRRLSLEACVHAAQNERLPLRIVVQVLFSEQLKVRNAISGTTLAHADHIAGLPLHQHEHLQQQQQPQQQQQDLSRPTEMPVQDGVSCQMDIRALQQDVLFMKARFAELLKDYTLVTQQVEKLTKQTGSWVKRLFQSKDNRGERFTSFSLSHPRWSRGLRNSIS